jgi:hypothetical protein
MRANLTIEPRQRGHNIAIRIEATNFDRAIEQPPQLIVRRPRGDNVSQQHLAAVDAGVGEDAGEFTPAGAHEGEFRRGFFVAPRLANDDDPRIAGSTRAEPKVVGVK